MIKSDALESSKYYTITYSFTECPYCKTMNKICLGDLDDWTVADAEAGLCHNCTKKYWLPGSKDVAETNAGIGWNEPLMKEMQEALGLSSEQDLIESALCEKGLEP